MSRAGYTEMSMRCVRPRRLRALSRFRTADAGRHACRGAGMQNKEQGGCEMPVAGHTSGFGGAMHEGAGMVARAIENPDPAFIRTVTCH
jgi:hypothetical protein